MVMIQEAICTPVTRALGRFIPPFSSEPEIYCAPSRNTLPPSYTRDHTSHSDNPIEPFDPFDDPQTARTLPVVLEAPSPNNSLRLPVLLISFRRSSCKRKRRWPCRSRRQRRSGVPPPRLVSFSGRSHPINAWTGQRTCPTAQSEP